jgi:acyl-CoA thioesterase I
MGILHLLCAPMKPTTQAAYLASLLLVAVCGSTRAEQHASPAEICLTANRGISLGVPLSRTGARLKAGGPLRIVAVGSSSTRGLGVLSPSAA